MWPVYQCKNVANIGGIFESNPQSENGPVVQWLHFDQLVSSHSLFWRGRCSREVFPRPWRLAFRPKCPRSGNNLEFREDQHLWHCPAIAGGPGNNKRRECGYSGSDFLPWQAPPWNRGKCLSFVNDWLYMPWSDQVRTIQNLDLSAQDTANLRFCCSVVVQSWLQNQKPISPGKYVNLTKRTSRREEGSSSCNYGYLLV